VQVFVHLRFLKL